MNIKQQERQLEKCAAILELIRRNNNYLATSIEVEQALDFLFGCGKKNNYEMRKKINDRLICYYAKELAKLASEPYECAFKIQTNKH